MRLELVNNSTFSVENIGEFMLEPSENFKKLKQLIERLEEEFSEVRSTIMSIHYQSHIITLFQKCTSWSQ